MRGDLDADVVIIGGGIVGIVAARLLKDRGHRVALIEAGRAGHGVTGRSTAKVTAQHSTRLQRIENRQGAEAARVYAAANLAGVKLIDELARRYKLACDLEPADSWVYAVTEDGARQLETEQRAAERAGLPMELFNQTDLPYEVRAALRLPDQRQFQPADFVAQLATTLPGDGSVVFEDSPATGWSGNWVGTAQGSVSARHVIMATHLPLGQVGQLHAHTSPHMHPVLAVPVNAGRAPSGMYISIDGPKRSVRAHRRSGGELMLILSGPTFQHGDVPAEADAFGELDSYARETFGYTAGGYRWTNEDYIPRDGLPYVGWSGVERDSILIATGFDAWGLSNGAAAGLVLADLCEGRDNGWSACFAASRHSVHGLSELAGNAASFARNLVKGHTHHPPSLHSSGGSEGEIVEVEGRAAGLYLDASGDMHAVSAVCTHMGCLVGWNPVDRTWDCPCHGSRFATDGQVVHGPAIEPLSTLQFPREEED